jgi:hypothetical protein
MSSRLWSLEGSLETEREWLFVGQGEDGTECRIGNAEWEAHCAKRPAIATALDLVITAMTAPETVLPDRQRMDEPTRQFRLHVVSGHGAWMDYSLVVAVKSVRQETGEWINFYQSCWYQRKKEIEP